jgi:hypothetical protein
MEISTTVPLSSGYLASPPHVREDKEQLCEQEMSNDFEESHEGNEDNDDNDDDDGDWGAMEDSTSEQTETIFFRRLYPHHYYGAEPQVEYTKDDENFAASVFLRDEDVVPPSVIAGDAQVQTSSSCPAQENGEREEAAQVPVDGRDQVAQCGFLSGRRYTGHDVAMESILYESSDNHPFTELFPILVIPWVEWKRRELQQRTQKHNAKRKKDVSGKPMTRRGTDWSTFVRRQSGQNWLPW